MSIDIDQTDWRNVLPNSTIATVHDLKLMNGKVWQVLLKPLEDYPFQAGQFTELLIEGFQFLYFTIGSAPHNPCLELHVQGGTETNDRLIEHLRQQGSVSLAPAGGRCILPSLPSESGPILLIASGTGFSQVKAMVEDSIAHNANRPIYIYWASYKLSQLYMLEKAESWAEHEANIHLTALISEHSHWEDNHQMLLHSILSEQSDFALGQAIICGSPKMVYCLFDALVEKGFRADHILSDVFDFAPRSEA
jgi:NAD(P)H-flavin reductase